MLGKEVSLGSPQHQAIPKAQAGEGDGTHKGEMGEEPIEVLTLRWALSLFSFFLASFLFYHLERIGDESLLPHSSM